MNKPPYKIPSMEKIKNIPWNGFNVISTFSGAGGSSLGYKMAGFKVLWANEFIPAAQEVYRLNHPDTILNIKDIREIEPQEILNEIGLKKGELDILDGSPPCASFSTAGKREKRWGQVKKYSDSEQRVDDLFYEFSRILEGLQPKIFLAENVSGLVKGSAKGYFLEILDTLKKCGYQVETRLLDARYLGVPQMRQRIFFQGIRNDIKRKPVFPKPLPYFYTVNDALPHIEFFDKGKGFGQIQKVSTQKTSFDTIGTSPSSGNGLSGKVYSKAIHTTRGQFSYGDFTNKLSPTIMAQGSKQHQIHNELEKRSMTIEEVKKICSFPDDFILTGTFRQQWERLGRAVPPVMMYHIAKTIRDEILNKL